jgi:hypothetical protein
MIDKILKAQVEFKPLRKTKQNPYYHSSYAGLDDVMDSIQDALKKYGLVITSQSAPHEKGLLLTTTIYDIETKQSIQSSFFIGELDPQKIGSGMTYARRYNIVNLLNLVADEDDDGNATKPEPKKIEKHTEVQGQSQLLPGDVIPKWWWDLKKQDWKEAGKYMPKGYGPKKIDGIFYVSERDNSPISYEDKGEVF